MIVQFKDDYGKPRYVGEITNGVFVTKRKKSKHLFRKTNSWGLDCKVLDKMVQMENANHIKYIVIIEEEESINYVTKPTEFKMKSNVLQFGGHRPQYFMPVQEWTEVQGGTIDEIIRRYESRKASNV